MAELDSGPGPSLPKLRDMTHAAIQDAWALSVWEAIHHDPTASQEAQAIALVHCTWLPALIQAKLNHIEAMAHPYDTCEVTCYPLSTL